MKFTCRRAQIATGRGVVVCAHIVEKIHKCSPSELSLPLGSSGIISAYVLFSSLPLCSDIFHSNLSIMCNSSAFLWLYSSFPCNARFETWLTGQRAWHKQLRQTADVSQIELLHTGNCLSVKRCLFGDCNLSSCF